MASSEQVRAVSVETGTAVSIYRFILEAADGFYDHSGAQGDADGVSGEAAAAAGKTIPMIMMDDGIAKVEAGAAITVLDEVASDSTGRVIAHVSNAGDYRLGKALDAAAAAGDIIRVRLHRELDEVS